MTTTSTVASAIANRYAIDRDPGPPRYSADAKPGSHPRGRKSSSRCCAAQAATWSDPEP